MLEAGVRIGESVDLAVLQNAFRYFWGKMTELVSPHVVGDEIADQKAFAPLRQKGMREVIHSCKFTYFSRVNIFIAAIKDQTATLTAEESWHCAKVLRKRVGDEIALIDGKGNFYLGHLLQVEDRQCVAAIDGKYTRQKPKGYRLHLAVAPTKQIDRVEWLVEKCVEIGIDEISFLQCRNSERVNVKTERIVKIVESAVKQSLQAYIPQVNPVRRFEDFVKDAGADIKLIAHCAEAQKTSMAALDLKERSVLILIGPEGDFSPEEIALAEQAGFRSLHLGENRLRTETAGLYACLAVSILAQGFEPRPPQS